MKTLFGEYVVNKSVRDSNKYINLIKHTRDFNEKRS